MDWSEALRRKLRQRAGKWAKSGDLRYYRSLGQNYTVLFESEPDGSGHGNFHPDSWRMIQSDPEWSRRLSKRHSQSAALPESKRNTACELDSSNSSDALLMNCFCFPGACHAILRGLGLPSQSVPPVFGYKARLKLSAGSADATEIDMKIGSLLFEAKLTEKDFTSRPKEHVLRYNALRETFDIDSLPSDERTYASYQLIRNVLAAMQLEANLIVLIDQRRPDLLHEWWAVHSSIRDPALRKRCSFRTWQEVASAAPAPLAKFLDRKYGISS